MSYRSARSVVGMIALSFAVTATAGTVLETVSRDLNGGGGTTSTLTYAQGGKMRVEVKPGDSLMIFKDETIYGIDTQKKSYHVMDRAAMKRMAAQVNPALKQMEEQLAKMPPEQRAQMEKMLGSMTGMTGKPKTRDVRKTSRSDKIGGQSCSYVEVREDGELQDEVCVASPGAMKGAQELLDAAKKMSVLMKEMLDSLDSPWLKDMVSNGIQNFEALGGIPLLTRHYSGGKPVNETTLKSIRSEAVPASVFDIPAGYTQTDMMNGQ